MKKYLFFGIVIFILLYIVLSFVGAKMLSKYGANPHKITSEEKSLFCEDPETGNSLSLGDAIISSGLEDYRGDFECLPPEEGGHSGYSREEFSGDVREDGSIIVPTVEYISGAVWRLSNFKRGCFLLYYISVNDKENVLENYRCTGLLSIADHFLNPKNIIYLFKLIPEL